MRNATSIGRLASLGLLLGALVAVCAFAALTVAIVQSQDRARDDAIRRFDDRGKLAAQLLSGSFHQSSTRQSADAQVRLSGRVTPATLKSWEGESDPAIPYTAVYDQRGELLAAYPPSARPAATPSGRQALKEATGGSPSTSDVTRLPSGRFVESFVPFSAGENGIRVLLIALPLDLTSQFAEGALQDVAGTPGGGAFVLDRAGVLVASVGEGATQPTAKEEVVDAVRRERPLGSVDGNRFVVDTVAGTGFVVALVAPEDELAADLPSTLWPRLSLVGLAIALVAVFWLTARLLGDAKRIRAARDEAERANRAKTAFVASVSHEVRTPLNSISGAAQMLTADPGSAPHVRELAEGIRASAAHLSQMLDDLIDISAIEQEQLRLAPSRVNVAAVCREVVDAARPLAAERDLTIDLRSDPDLGEVATDPARLRQALYNYVHNAVKFSPRGSTISMSTAREADNFFRIEVANPGPSISPADQRRLFAAFERLDSGEPGSGLGLAITRHVVEAQGGTVGVTSAPGDDTRFWLRLPAALVEEGAPATSWIGGRILVVDDHAESRRLAQWHLSQEGFEVSEAGTIAEASRLFSELGEIDALIVDGVLPDGDGLELVTAFRADPSRQGSPVFILSGRAAHADRERGFGAGASEYFVKPVDYSALTDALRSALVEGRIRPRVGDDDLP